MSWITNLAGQAETILNKIDSETASIFSKDKSKISGEHFTTSDHKRSSSYTFPSSSSVPSNLDEFENLSAHSVPTNYKEGGSLSTTPKRKSSTKKNKEQEKSFIDFLNDTKKKSDSHLIQSKEANTSSKEIGHSRQSSVSSGSSFLAVSGRETPAFTALEIDTNSGGSHSSDAYINVEASVDAPLSTPSSFNSNDSDGGVNNTQTRKETHSEVLLLRKEVSSLNQEMVQILRRAKESERESQRQREQVATLSLQLKQSEALLKGMQNRETELLETLRAKEEFIITFQKNVDESDSRIQERERANKELQEQNQRLLQGADASNNLHSELLQSLKDKLEDSENALKREREKHSLTDKQLSARITQLEEDQKTLSKDFSNSQRQLQNERNKITTLNNQMSSLKSELSTAREELTDYKTKAGRILQSKDNLITSLKEGKEMGGNKEGLEAEEVEQLRGERDLLREELEKCGEKIKLIIEQAAQTEALAQHEASEALNRVTHLQEDLSRERSEAGLLQEELKQSKMDLQCLQEELRRQRVNISSRIQERDQEIERLQKQIAHKQSSSSSTAELENRIHSLTESLIHKQSSIESLSTEKHTLHIQLERLQQQYNESQTMLNKDPTSEYTSDEARNRVPSFLIESPFDGGVTRRVKKAYGSLDKFSIRLGVFLRRYPIARVFVLLYMGLLHFWVMIVLLTYTPEVHGPDFTHPYMSHLEGPVPNSHVG